MRHPSLNNIYLSNIFTINQHLKSCNIYYDFHLTTNEKSYMHNANAITATPAQNEISCTGRKIHKKYTENLLKWL